MERANNWHFTSYEKIAETPDQWQLDEAGFRQLEKVTWIVTEKIHGANFCIMTDGKTIHCANRKHLLGPQDDFFHYQAVVGKLSKKLLLLFPIALKKEPQISQLFLYGELFGGGYPHKDVVAIPLVQPVQTGVYYSPEIEFCIFDFAISRADGERIYLDYADVVEICKEVELLYARPLFIGNYQDALSYPVGFQSTLPALLGLPELENNPAEGIVIKPSLNLLVSSKKGLLRPILKKKIPEFAEDKRFAQAEKWSVGLPTSTRTQEPLELLKWEIFNLVTVNRLQSAISKAGPVTRSQPGKASQLFRLVIEDIYEQLIINQRELLADLTTHERVLLERHLQEEVRILFKTTLPGSRQTNG